MGAPASPQVIGRYAIYGKIAQGGMASVHFGRLQAAAGFSRTVAVKRLHPHLAEEPEFVSTLIDEARMAARIHHPNVVPTLDVVAEGGELLVVMEYVRGESLARLLKAEVARKRRVPLPVASAVMLGALAGLHAAHEATSDRGAPLGIVHRDVSPQNILVGVDGVARIIDFGVAKAAGRLQTTREGVIKGKLAYMAPEQLTGVETARVVDVYAMGVVFWEMLSGRSLFKADSDAALVVKVLAGANEPPSRHTPNLPAGLDALVMTALSRDPADRFATASDMADVLVRVVPPALPKDVGAWVQELARESLLQRAGTLAEIESASGMATVRPPASGAKTKVASAAAAGARAAQGANDEAATVASQPSSLSVETPRPSLAPGWRSRRARLASAIGAAALVVLGVAAVLWRSGGTSTAASAGPAGPSSVASVAPAPPPAPSPSGGESAPGPSAAAAPTATASTAATHATGTPASPTRSAATVARPRPSPSPAGSFRFAQPD